VESSDQSTRAPLEVRRSCLRRAQTRRARPIRLACCSPAFIPHSEFRTPHSYDPLLCSRCGGTMKVIAVIEPACADTCLRRSRDRQAADRRPAVTCLPAGRSGRSARLSSRRSLDHLGLASTPPSLRAPPDQPDGGAAERPREWAYEPLFDLPVRRTCLPPACALHADRSRGDRQAQTGDLPIPDPPCLPAGRCSYRRGRWTGPFRLAPRSLRV